jgi:signal transduction histidine kinase/CheY-like chemotaxis protein/HPt (histidine-containing phosphotransfer) domain-containing protein
MSQVRSLSQKLRVIVVSTTLVALSIALVGNAAISILSFRRVQAADLASQADLLARMTSPAIMFDDPKLATENLRSVEMRSQIEAVAIYSANGRLFAQFRSPNFKGDLPASPGPNGGTRDGGSLVLFKPIIRDGTSLGTIYLRADEGLGERIRREALVAFLVGVVALAIALAMVQRMQRVVLRPIAAVSAAAHEVVAQGDYSRRVVRTSDDELGEMTEAFNHMLAEIERGKTELEARVAERTIELEASNRQLAYTKLQAEEASLAKSSFLASMSHEIRTPMNGVIGMVDVLHQTSLTGAQVEMVDLVRESAFSLLTVIDDILDFSKIEADRLDLELVPIHLGEVVEKACNLMDSLALRNEVEFLAFVDPRLPDLLLGDALRLRQILVNLINNAIKFSSGGERMGRVSVRALMLGQSDAGTSFRIEVTDNGIGMDAETCSRLFRPFSQADTSTTRRFGGSGLGLVISRRLAALMGGRIAVESEPGKGSTFSLSLMLPRPPEPEAPASAAPQKLAGLRCLVVGADPGVAGDAKAYLEASGAQVERVASLAAAREHVATAPAGRWVWVIDGGLSPPGPPTLLALVKTLEDRPVQFVVMGRGPRREPQLTRPNFVELDGNVLTRRRIDRAVMLAARLETEDPERNTPGQSRLPAKAPTRAQALQQGRLILVAEDNETNRKVILRQLALLGYAADVADDGEAALERWRSEDYALLLTDLHMPRMDGYELTAAIRARERPGIAKPIIALTANALKGEAERCMDAGMSAYLSKPLQLAHLKSVLEQWLPEEDATVLPLDVRVLEQLVGNDAEVVRDMLRSFSDSANRIAAAMRRAFDSGDSDGVGAQAHSLKSAAHTVGAVRLGALCERLERVARGSDQGELVELRPAFDAEMRRVNDALVTYSGRS